MKSSSNNVIATPPGKTIVEQLYDRGMNLKVFATRMNISEEHADKLIHGKVPLTPEITIRLEQVLGIPADFWIRLEFIYRQKLKKLIRSIS